MERLSRLSASDQLVTSVVGLAELLKGIERLEPGSRREHLRQACRAVLSGMDEILEISPAVAVYFARIESQLRRAGQPIPVNDIWVAAVAMRHGAALVSNDAHFRRIDGLRVESWSA